MFEEFKKFAMRGNVIDMAVGVIIGGAFGKIVSSFVDDVMMPGLGILIGDVDFTNNFFILAGPKGPFATLQEAKAAGAVTLNYGVFLGSVFNFLIIAIALFFLVKTINSLKADEPAATPTNKKCEYCFMDIPINATKCPYCTADLHE